MYLNSELNYIFKKINKIQKFNKNKKIAIRFYADGRLAIGHVNTKSVGNNCEARVKRIL